MYADCRGYLHHSGLCWLQAGGRSDNLRANGVHSVRCVLVLLKFQHKVGPMSVDQNTVRKVAHLARIAVQDDELDHFAKEMSTILDWVEQLSEVDTDHVEPMTSAVAQNMRLRADEATSPPLRDEVTRNASGSKDGFFAVPKVVE